jgi:hypothetical protein|tara:strand:- start:4723 stop:5367 length:645 start_codon:yes stop_codon:yes gene_type:complete
VITRRSLRPQADEQCSTGIHGIREAALVVAGTTTAVFLVCLVALWIFAGPGRARERREIVIPAGTADLIAAGENPLDLPANWSFRSGDVLVLDNRDDVGHYVGAWFSPYGEVTEITVTASATVFCTLHPAGQIYIDVTPRRTDWMLAVPPTLLIGPAFGLVLLMALRMLQRLEDPETVAAAEAARRRRRDREPEPVAPGATGNPGLSSLITGPE